MKLEFIVITCICLPIVMFLATVNGNDIKKKSHFSKVESLT